MKVYISADMEGIAGAVTREQLTQSGFEYQQAREQMTAEVLMAIQGARAAGATTFVVSDSHGNGQNLLQDRLPNDALLVRSWPRPLGMADGIDGGGFACAFLIGFHAGADNCGGSLSHTLSSRALHSLKINGRVANEAMLCAGIAGHFDVPVTMISGDDVFIEETGSFLEGVQTVMTKRSRGLFSAHCRAAADVLSDLREKAQRAVELAKRASPFRLGTPISVELSLNSRLSAEYGCYLPGVKRIGANTIAFEAATAPEMMAMLIFFLNYKPQFE